MQVGLREEPRKVEIALEPDVHGERRQQPFAVHIGFKCDLDLPGFLTQADLHPVSIEKVNIPPIWSLVTCIKD